MKYLIAILALVAGISFSTTSSAAPVATYDLAGANGLTSPVSSTAATFTFSDMTAVGFGGEAFDSHFYFTGWGAARDAGKYLSLTADRVGAYILTDMTFSVENTSVGPATVVVRSSRDGFATDIDSFTWTTADVTNGSFNLSSLGTLAGPVELRFYFFSVDVPGHALGFANHEPPTFAGFPDVGRDVVINGLGVVPVNGACGTDNGTATAFPPSANLCAAGTAGAVLSAAPWSWQCAGSGGGTTASCSAPNQTIPSSGGNGRAVISGGTWAVNLAVSSGFIPTTGHAKSPPGLPPGISFPHGLLDFTLTGGGAGSTATITITYPSAIPAGATYWKYGPSPAGFNCSGAACAAPHWYEMPAGQAVIAGNTITLTIVDGGVGDDDLAANGTIVDQGGPGVPGGVAAIPTLSEWGMILMSTLLAFIGVAHLRRRQPGGLVG